MPDFREDMFFFQGGSNVRLLGFLSEPANDAKRTGIVYCHPFAEEKNCSHAIIAKAAREFAAQGFPVFRFDFSGCGDSEGDMPDFTLDNWLDDIRSAINEFKSRTSVDRIILWGLRLGATMATKYASLNKDIAGLLLWQPVFKPGDFMRQFLRQNLASSITHNKEMVSVSSLVQQIESGENVYINGYPIANPLYGSFNTVHQTLTWENMNCPVCVSSISNMPMPPMHMTHAVVEIISANQHSRYAHFVTEPFWDRYWQWDSPDVVSSTREWLTHLA